MNLLAGCILLTHIPWESTSRMSKMLTLKKVLSSLCWYQSFSNCIGKLGKSSTNIAVVIWYVWNSKSWRHL